MLYKYFLILTNQRKFYQHKFDDNRIQQTSETLWLPMNFFTRTEYVIQTTRTELELNDNLLNIGGLMTEHHYGFFNARMANRELPYPNDFHNALTFEMNLGKKVYFRRVYSSLDFFADIGGLFAAIRVTCLAILMLTNYYSSYQFIMHDLFIHSVDDDQGGGDDKDEQN